MMRNRRIDKGTSLKMFKIQLWLQILPVVALLATFLLLFNVFRSSVPRYERGRLIAYCLLQIDYRLSKSMNVVSIIALWYLIYLMIFKSILSNNIKSNSVVSCAPHGDFNGTIQLR